MTTVGQVTMLVGIAILAFGPTMVRSGYATAVGAVAFGSFAAGRHVFRTGLTEEIRRTSKASDKPDGRNWIHTYPRGDFKLP